MSVRSEEVPEGPVVGFDELLGYEEPVDPPRRSGAGAVVKSVVKSALLVAVGTAAGLFGLQVVGMTAPLTVVAICVLALVLLWHLVRAVGRTPDWPIGGPAARRRLAEPPDDDVAYFHQAPDGMRREVVRWEKRLAWHAGAKGKGAFAEHLRPKLMQLTNERLRQIHGVTVNGDPARARTVLGEPLWSMLTGAADEPPSRREFEQAVTRLEELHMRPTGEGAVRG